MGHCHKKLMLIFEYKIWRRWNTSDLRNVFIGIWQEHTVNILNIEDQLNGWNLINHLYVETFKTAEKLNNMELKLYFTGKLSVKPETKIYSLHNMFILQYT